MSDLPADAANTQAAALQITALEARNAELEQQLQQCRQALEQSQKLRESCETDVHRILDSAIASICSFWVFADHSWRLNYYSAGCEAVFGYTAAELTADQSLWQARIFPEDLRTVIQPSLKNFFAERSGQREYRFYHKNGNLRWIAETYHSRRDETADGWLVTVVDTDITTHKQTEAALRESEERFRYTFENAGIGMAWVGQDGQWLKVNPALCDLTGYSEAELLATNFQSITHPADLPASLAHAEELWRGALTSCQVERRYRHKQGHDVLVWLTASLIRDIAGHPLHVALQINDVTARKQAEAALKRQAQRDRVLNQIIQAIRQSLDLNIILTAATAEIAALLEIERVAIVQYLPTRQCWRTIAAYHCDPALPQLIGSEIPDEGNPFAAKLKQLEVVRVAHTDTIEDAINQEIARALPGAWLLIPLAIGGVCWGNFSLITTQAHDWQDEQVEIAQAVADQLAIAIQQANLYQQAQLELAERKRTEQALRQSEERWHLAIAGSNDGIWDHNLITHEQFLSPRCLDIVGYDLAEANHFELWLSYVHPDDLNGLRAAIQHHLTRIHPLYSAEYRMRCKDGNYKWLLERGQALWDEQGKPIRMVGSLTDITARKTYETTLQTLNQALELRVQERTKQLQLALAAAQMGTWEWDLVTDIEYWSPEVYRTLDLQTDAQGRVLDADGVEISPFSTNALFKHYVHPDDRAMIQQKEQEARVTRSPLEYEFRVLTQSGNLRWCYSRGSYLYDEQGQAIKLAGVTMDITERAQLEAERNQVAAALQQSEERFRGVFDHAPIGMAVADLGTYRFIVVNDAFCKLMGYSKPEMLDLACNTISHPEDLAAEQPYAQALMRGEIDSYQMEKRYSKKDGSILFANLTATILWDAAGTPTQILGMVQDISSRKQAEAQLRTSLKEKEILLKEVHHRVKNNLQLVSSLLNLQAGTIQDPSLLEPFRESQHRVKVIALIHEQLYRSNDLARLNFSDYVNNLISNLWQSYIAIGSGITLQGDIACVELAVDIAIPCGLIINELVSNAIKHAFPDNRSGEINLYFNLNDIADEFTLTVSDNGIGIPDDFDIRQTESLGLQVVCELTNQLHGILQVDRRQGTAFQITFPNLSV